MLAVGKGRVHEMPRSGLHPGTGFLQTYFQVHKEHCPLPSQNIPVGPAQG